MQTKMNVRIMDPLEKTKKIRARVVPHRASQGLIGVQFGLGGACSSCLALATHELFTSYSLAMNWLSSGYLLATQELFLS